MENQIKKRPFFLFEGKKSSLSPALKSKIEELFDKEDFVDMIIDLVDNNRLGGAMVETANSSLASPANIRIDIPYIWEDEKMSDVNPKYDVYIRFGWEDLELFPDGPQNIFIPGTDLSELRTNYSEKNLSSHYLWVNGTNYKITGILSASQSGSRIEIESPLYGLNQGKGIIHCGADSVKGLIDGDRIARKEGAISDTYKRDLTPPPTSLKFSVPDGNYSFSLIFSLGKQKRSIRRKYTVNTPIWKDVFVDAPFVEYQRLIPSIAPEEKNAFNSISAILYIRYRTKERPKSSPPIKGIQYTIEGEGIFSKRANILYIDDPGNISLGEMPINIDRTVRGFFFDMLGRPVYTFYFFVPAQESSVVPSDSFMEDFKELTNNTVSPLYIDLDEIKEEITVSMDELKSRAERIVKPHSVLDISFQSEQ